MHKRNGDDGLVQKPAEDYKPVNNATIQVGIGFNLFNFNTFAPQWRIIINGIQEAFCVYAACSVA